MSEGTRAIGRLRRKFRDGVKAVVGCGSIAEVVRIAEDRARWRYIVANINIQDSARRFYNILTSYFMQVDSSVLKAKLVLHPSVSISLLQVHPSQTKLTGLGIESRSALKHL